MSSLKIALPSVGKDFSVNAVMLAWLTIANILASAVFLLPFGKLSDSYDRTKFYIASAIIQCLTSFFAAWSPNVGWLFTARLLQGVAGAMAMTSYPALLIAEYPVADRGRVLGINTAAIYTGISFSPFLGGVLTQHFGWRSIFIFSGIMVSIYIPQFISQC